MCLGRREADPSPLLHLHRPFGSSPCQLRCNRQEPADRPVDPVCLSRVVNRRDRQHHEADYYGTNGRLEARKDLIGSVAVTFAPIGGAENGTRSFKPPPDSTGFAFAGRLAKPSAGSSFFG